MRRWTMVLIVVAVSVGVNGFLYSQRAVAEYNCPPAGAAAGMPLGRYALITLGASEADIRVIDSVDGTVWKPGADSNGNFAWAVALPPVNRWQPQPTISDLTGLRN